MLSCSFLSHNRPRWLLISTTKFALLINIFNNIYTMIVSLDFRTSCHELDPGFYLSRFFSSLHRTYDVPKFVDRLQHRHTYIYTRNMYNLFTLIALPEICSSKFISNLFFVFKIHTDFSQSAWICSKSAEADWLKMAGRICLNSANLDFWPLPGLRSVFAVDSTDERGKLEKSGGKKVFFFVYQRVGFLNACVKVIEKVERKKRSSRDWQIDWLRQTWHGNSGPE